MFRAICISLLIGLAACTQAKQAEEQPVETKPAKPVFPVTADYLDDHPSKIWMQAAAYMEVGEMEAATTWFYAGQLRYRVHLDCPAMQASPQDLIVYSAQFEILEPSVNQWAAENLEAFVPILEAVLDWDDENISRPTAYLECGKENAMARDNYYMILEAARSE